MPSTLPNLEEEIALNAFPDTSWKGIPIRVVLSKLEEVAERAGIRIHYEELSDGDIQIRGGYCRLRDRRMIFIDPRTKEMDRLRIFIQALRKVDLEGLYILPAIRELILGSPGE